MGHLKRAKGNGKKLSLNELDFQVMKNIRKLSKQIQKYASHADRRSKENS
jgi:hypothetical protein